MKNNMNNKVNRIIVPSFNFIPIPPVGGGVISASVVIDNDGIVDFLIT